MTTIQIINVEYFAQARAIAVVSEQTLVLGGGDTLLDLARAVAKQHGPRMEALVLTPQGELSSTVIFAVNGNQVAPGEDTSLNDGDTVTIVPPISGGRA